MNLTFDVALNHDNAAAWLRDAQARLAAAGSADALTIDASALREFDSSALSVLLALERSAQQRGIGLVMHGLPAKLRALAEVYGVDTLLAAAA